MNAETKILKAKDAPDLGSFDWSDPFRLNGQLNEDERMVRSQLEKCAHFDQKSQKMHFSNFHVSFSGHEFG